MDYPLLDRLFSSSCPSEPLQLDEDIKIFSQTNETTEEKIYLEKLFLESQNLTSLPIMSRIDSLREEVLLALSRYYKVLKQSSPLLAKKVILTSASSISSDCILNLLASLFFTDQLFYLPFLLPDRSSLSIPEWIGVIRIGIRSHLFQLEKEDDWQESLSPYKTGSSHPLTFQKKAQILQTQQYKKRAFLSLIIQTILFHLSSSNQLDETFALIPLFIEQRDAFKAIPSFPLIPSLGELKSCFPTRWSSKEELHLDRVSLASLEKTLLEKFGPKKREGYYGYLKVRTSPEWLENTQSFTHFLFFDLVSGYEKYSLGERWSVISLFLPLFTTNERNKSLLCSLLLNDDYTSVLKTPHFHNPLFVWFSYMTGQLLSLDVISHSSYRSFYSLLYSTSLDEALLEAKKTTFIDALLLLPTEAFQKLSITQQELLFSLFLLEIKEQQEKRLPLNQKLLDFLFVLMEKHPSLDLVKNFLWIFKEEVELILPDRIRVDRPSLVRRIVSCLLQQGFGDLSFFERMVEKLDYDFSYRGSLIHLSSTEETKIERLIQKNWEKTPKGPCAVSFFLLEMASALAPLFYDKQLLPKLKEIVQKTLFPFFSDSLIYKFLVENSLRNEEIEDHLNDLSESTQPFSPKEHWIAQLLLYFNQEAMDKEKGVGSLDYFLPLAQKHLYLLQLLDRMFNTKSALS